VIGEFESRKSRTKKDAASGKTITQPRPSHEWNTVKRPDLAIVERALYDRNQVRLAAEKKVGGPRAKRKKYSGLRGRGLLSSTVACASCGGNMYYRTAEYKLACEGAVKGNCNNFVRVNSTKVEDYILAILRSLIVDDRVLRKWLDFKVEALREAAVETVDKTPELKERLANLKLELASVLKEKRGVFGASRDEYLKEEAEINSEIADVEGKLNLAGSEPDLIATWTERISQFTDIFARLNTLRSEGSFGWKRDATGVG
jgi:hypothetical protein